MIQHSWSDLEGQALEDYRFRLAEDPRLLWSIAEGKAAPDTFIGILQYYEFEGERLPCCVCNRSIHNSGAVIHLTDHTLRLVGSCCGRKHFGPTWALEKSAFERAERTALNQKRARRILGEWPTLEMDLYRLREPLNRIEAARRELKRGFAERFHSVATELFRSAGRLSYVERLGTSVADQGGTGGLRSLERDTQRIVGWELYSLTDKRKELEQSISAIKHCLDGMREALNYGRVTYRHIRIYQECRDRLVRIVELHNAASSYGQAQNATTFNFWFSKNEVSVVIDATDDEWIFRTPWATTNARIDKWDSIGYPELLIRAIEDER